MALQIGYAQDTITPPLDPPVYLAGFGRDRVAGSVHDDLTVRALALVQGEVRLVAAALDLVGLGRQHCQAVERRVSHAAPGMRLLLACTHTHHGPDTIGLWGPDLATSGVNPAYLDDLQAKIKRTALAALARLQTASLRSASVQVSGVAKNARNPDILDEELTCLQFCHPQTAAPLATWLVYPCHPEVLGDQNPAITSDYIGFLRRAVEAATSAPCLAMVGALGGMMTPAVEAHSFVEAEHMGHTLAQAALAALSGAPARLVERLEHCRREVSLPMTNPLFRMAMQSGLLPNMLNADGTLTSVANLLKVGPAWLLGVPGELLPKLGLALKAEMRAAGAEVAAVVGLMDDELGYILPAEDFVYPEDPLEPGGHYEETMSIGRQAGPGLQRAAHELIAA